MVSARPAIYPDDLAARLTPGARWRPANGTEGDFFYAAWCAGCAGDVGGDCVVLLFMMACDVDDPSYPPEMRIDGRGQPSCAAFRPIGAAPPAERCPATPDLFAGAADV